MDRTAPHLAAEGWPRSDSTTRYGTVSRCLHWGMAACFAIVFAAALAHYFAKDSAAEALLWPAHKPVGFLLFVLVALRVVWALMRARRRPPHLSAAARWGHRALYLLMIAVPSIGLLRQYGSARAFEPFGLQVMDAREDGRIGWMVELGGLVHGELGWALLALVTGHIAMVLWHRRSGHDVLPRMAGD
ncbi:cytochrome b [Variovorax sp. J22P168]|uniref:cytochrome b n=1 Tax=Variovorax jilinensis TaxID=3053513 RepID=UPI0025786D16|nr:cytochrome b [Variovorax sp. J22P168]MDM0011127.1 cytochrome b [Variovorax sp. J22P168]